MKAINQSRVHRVFDTKAATVFTDPAARRLLLWFVHRPRAAGEAARELEIDLKRLHYRLEKLVRLGLLRIVERRARAGRAVKYYQTVARAFYVSNQHAPISFGEALSREVRAALASESARASQGILFTASRNGSPRGRVVSDPDQLSQSVEMWRILRLKRADATALRLELNALLNRYQKLATGTAGDVHLVHAAVVRRLDQSGAVDNLPAPAR